jgi:hypothetical protein
LSLSTIATAAFAIVESDRGVIAPVAGYVGIKAIRDARQLVAGTVPLF